MSQNLENISSDLFKLKEKINDIEWKSKAYDESQKEIAQLRQELLTKDSMLEDSKRKLNDLKMQLQSANEIIVMVEKEKAQSMNEKVQLQINYDTSLKERESLIRQTREAKFENVSLKLNVQKLTETVNSNEAQLKHLEKSFKETKERFFKVKSFLESNITKLEKEHNLLMKSVESTEQLNKKLQAVTHYAHAAILKKNEELQKIQKDLIMNTQPNILPIEDDGNIFNFKSEYDAKALLEHVRSDIEKYDKKHKEMENILDIQNSRNSF